MSDKIVYDLFYNSEKEVDFLIKIPISKSVAEFYGSYFSDFVIELDEIIITPEDTAPTEVSPEDMALANSIRVNNLKLASQITDGAVVLTGSIVSTGEASLRSLNTVVN
ncbi:MAG: hypothetical protein LBR11_02930 [Deltaproteobacteria bacterium]|jgi:hypothetical protein|nr:hypothetical protein [Deltaproteobacteria bacterium]